MSSRFTRHGVPGMTSRQPSQRIATLSLTMVRIVTPMISIGTEDSRGAGRPGQGPAAAREGPRGEPAAHRDGHRGRVAGPEPARLAVGRFVVHGPARVARRRAPSRPPPPAGASPPRAPRTSGRVKAPVMLAVPGRGRPSRRRVAHGPIRRKATTRPSRSARKVRDRGVLQRAGAGPRAGSRRPSRRNTGRASQVAAQAGVELHQRRGIGAARRAGCVTPSGSGPVSIGRRSRTRSTTWWPKPRRA